MDKSKVARFLSPTLYMSPLLFETSLLTTTLHRHTTELLAV